MRAKRLDHQFILPGATKTDRSNVVSRELAAWMRALGWNRDRYPKAGHELRKWRGSEWYTKRGIEAASQWLRHADIGVTKRYYAAFIHHPPTLEVGE